MTASLALDPLSALRRRPSQLAPPPVEAPRWHSLDDDTWRRPTHQAELPLVHAIRRRTLAPGAELSFERQPTATAVLPPVEPLAARLGLAITEICAGTRPATQVLRHCSTQVFDSLVRRQAHTAGRARVRRPVRLRRARVCHVADGIVEACLVIDDSLRVRPMAVRFEGLDGRWIITALEIG